MKNLIFVIILCKMGSVSAQDTTEFHIKRSISTQEKHSTITLPKFIPGKTNIVLMDSNLVVGDTIKLNSSSLNITAYYFSWITKSGKSFQKEVTNNTVNIDFFKALLLGRKNEIEIFLGGFKCIDKKGVHSTFNIKYDLKF